MNRIVKYPIIAYQRVFSPLLPRTCRFYPTCSEYALRAFEEKNFWEALNLIVKRILKCHPFHPGGFDPVPRDGTKKNACKGNA